MLLTLALLAANISQVNFDILNNSKQSISHVWIAKHGSDQWGKDFLRMGPLLANQTFHITFTNKEAANNWDLRIRYGNREEIFDSLNLTEIKQLTIEVEKDGRWNAKR